MGEVMRDITPSSRRGTRPSAPSQHRPVRHRGAGARPGHATSRWRPTTAPATRWRRVGKFFRENGLYTFVRWNTFFTNPPLTITEEQLDEGLAIIDKGLEITDKAVR